MTRKSRREIEHALNDLDGAAEYTLQDYLWANLKDYHDGQLTHEERRLLDDAETHLPASAHRRIALGDSQ